MAIFQRLLARLNSLRRDAGEDDRLNLAVELPGRGNKPLWRMELQMHSEPHGDGEKLRLRAHIQTNLASALRPALEQSAETTPESARALTFADRTSRRMQRAAGRALQVPLVRTLAEPLLQHDLNTWVEINASTASLDQGSRDLLPQSEKLAALGIVPLHKDDAPVAQSWAGEAPGGFAQVSLLQVDKRHLPPDLQRALGPQPFQFAAAIVNTIEQK